MKIHIKGKYNKRRRKRRNEINIKLTKSKEKERKKKEKRKAEKGNTGDNAPDQKKTTIPSAQAI
jgi:hypothetical protein